MTPKILQLLMGHSDIGVTLNTYTHLGAKDVREELERLNLAGTSKGKMPRKIVKCYDKIAWHTTSYFMPICMPFA